MNLEAVECIRCHKTACYVDESFVEDIGYHLYCEKCVQITPKTVEKEGQP